MTKKLTELPVALSVPRNSPLLATDTGDGLSKQITKASIGINTVTAVKVANYTTLFGERVLYDPSGGTFQIDAPVTPTTGQRWAIKNVTVDVTLVTISGNGESLEDPGTSTLLASFTIAAAFVSLDYIYDGTNWVII